MNNLEEQLRVLFDEISNGAVKAMEDNVTPSDYYKKSGVSLVKLKTLNRELQLMLDSQRKEIDLKKSTVDKLQLDLENLMYKQSYLKKEIRSCKDLATPNLDEIEKELGYCLAPTKYTNLLEEDSQKAIDALKAEQNARIATQKSLEDLKTQSQAALDRLDKKRKFVEELPARLKLIQAATAELDQQFGSVLEDINPII